MKRVNIMKKRLEFEAHYTLWYEKFESCLLLVITMRFICSMEGTCLLPRTRMR